MESDLSITNTCPWLLDEVLFCMPISGSRSEAAVKKFYLYLENILDIDVKKEKHYESDDFHSIAGLGCLQY